MAKEVAKRLVVYNGCKIIPYGDSPEGLEKRRLYEVVNIIDKGFHTLYILKDDDKHYNSMLFKEVILVDCYLHEPTCGEQFKCEAGGKKYRTSKVEAIITEKYGTFVLTKDGSAYLLK
jgi:hypothetical protein